MTADYIKAGFECDKPGKVKLVKQLQVEAAKKGNYLKIDLQENDDTAHIDIYITAYTKEGREIATYAIEFKERPDTAHTDCFDWMVEDGKEYWLKQAEKQGYIPLYSYLWSDNYYALWNINTWDKSAPRPISKKRHTMGNYNENKKVYMNSFVTLSSAIKQGYLN